MRRRLRNGLRRLNLRSEKGQTFVMVAAAFPLILAIAAVVIDGTRLFVAHQQTQNAADAASLAAGYDLPAGGCTSTPMTCPAAVQDDASKYSQANGGPAIDHPCDPTNASDTDCWMTPVVIRGVSENWVQVRITENRNGYFAKAIGAGSLFHVKAVAAASPGSLSVVTTSPGTTSPGTTTSFTTTTLQTSTAPGNAAIMFAYGPWYPNNAPSAALCNPGGGQLIKISGHDNTFHGDVWSNGGVDNPGQNNGAPASDPLGGGFLFYVDPCAVSHPGNWVLPSQITEESTPITWPVPLPWLTCSAGPPGTSCQAGAVATTVTDDQGTVKPCTNLGSSGGNVNVTIDEPAGLYCSSGSINLKADQTNGAGFIAPSISFVSGAQFVGDTDLYGAYKGLLADGYAAGTGGGAGIQSPDKGASTEGAIFAPNGPANLPGGGTALLCGAIASCGFWEAVSINLPGDGSTYQGVGPEGPGVVSTTTIVSTTTVTLPGTTSGGTLSTTAITQDPGLQQ